jgi:hypothetical protein
VCLPAVCSALWSAEQHPDRQVFLPGGQAGITNDPISPPHPTTPAPGLPSLQTPPPRRRPTWLWPSWRQLSATWWAPLRSRLPPSPAAAQPPAAARRCPTGELKAASSLLSIDTGLACAGWLAGWAFLDCSLVLTNCLPPALPTPLLAAACAAGRCRQLAPASAHRAPPTRTAATAPTPAAQGPSAASAHGAQPAAACWARWRQRHLTGALSCCLPPSSAPTPCR